MCEGLAERDEAQDRSDWNRASSIMAMIHNVQCTKKSQMISPQRIHPYEKTRLTNGRRLTRGNVMDWAATMVKPKR